MRVWTEAVTDRNRVDIMARTPKAYLHATDFNRIEGNIAYLSERLDRLGYNIRLIQENNRDRDDIPKSADFKHICDSIEVITQAYYEPDDYADISEIPGKVLDYMDINNIEKNLSGIKDLIDRGTSHNYLKQFTHGELKAYTHEQIRRGDMTSPAP